MMLFSLAGDGAVPSGSHLAALSHDRPFIKTKAGRGCWLEDGGDLRPLSLVSLLFQASNQAMLHWPVSLWSPAQLEIYSLRTLENILWAQFSDRGTANLTCRIQALCQDILKAMKKHEKQSSDRQQYYKTHSKIYSKAPPRIPQSMALHHANSQPAGTGPIGHQHLA